MNWNNSKQRAAFFDLHSDNPREGPGDFVSTQRAFAAVSNALAGETRLQILDLACGPGLQTQHLAELAPDARITALDIHAPFVAGLADWVQITA